MCRQQLLVQIHALQVPGRGGVGGGNRVIIISYAFLLSVARVVWVKFHTSGGKKRAQNQRFFSIKATKNLLVHVLVHEIFWLTFPF